MAAMTYRHNMAFTSDIPSRVTITVSVDSDPKLQADTTTINVACAVRCFGEVMPGAEMGFPADRLFVTGRRSLACCFNYSHTFCKERGHDMSGKMIKFSANGRTASGYLAMPSQPGPGLILIQEWWGLVDHIRDLADRFAAEGFLVLAPDLFHGDMTRSPDQAGKLLMALNIAEAGKDIRGAARHLLGMHEAQPKKVGVLGFCMGGQLALFAGTEFPQEISAAVDFYGIHPNVVISPEKLDVPVLAHFAKRDKSVPEAEARALVEKLKAAGKSIEAHFYDADHAFFNDTRPEVHSPEAAKLAWTRSLTFLKTRLS